MTRDSPWNVPSTVSTMASATTTTRPAMKPASLGGPCCPRRRWNCLPATIRSMVGSQDRHACEAASRSLFTASLRCAKQGTRGGQRHRTVVRGTEAPDVRCEALVYGSVTGAARSQVCVGMQQASTQSAIVHVNTAASRLLGGVHSRPVACANMKWCVSAAPQVN
eukprot:scaffold17565_cov69-Phaeocystis_antarctica.AAC.2